MTYETSPDPTPQKPPQKRKGPVLTWEHTVIGGRTAPYDYSARDGDVLVGRVMRVEHGPGAGEWMWSMVARVGWGMDGITTHGREATKQAAADRVRVVYESRLRLRQARGQP